jgi:hypothetical protein
VPEFTTVFEITRNSNGVFGGTVFDLFIGVGALFGILAFLIRNWKRGIGAKGYIWAAFVLVWSLGWLSFHNFPFVFGHANKLMNAYKNRQYQVVEGPVEVLHQQPYHGHSEGDRIRVRGQEFVISYFYYTPAYTKTIAHGGALTQGTYARIYCYDSEILRVDIRK